ncbi:MAG: YqgE/AlgH family protein [Actinomycetota bacterium]|nr:YqgE/AlgH family protein [Actinomycetota bacterium]
MRVECERWDTRTNPATLRHNGSVGKSHRGKLLIASPVLSDFFERAVVLLLEHNHEEGAMGLVLNRSSDTRVAEAVPTLSDLGEDGEVIRVGGPVGQNSVVALGEFDNLEESSRPVIGDLGVLDPDRTESLRRLRVYAGHAGWAPGQLESELEQDAWVVAQSHPGDPFHEGDLWADALARMGGKYALLATMPADPSLN